jgi:hypothetical protein
MEPTTPSALLVGDASADAGEFKFVVLPPLFSMRARSQILSQ